MTAVGRASPTSINRRSKSGRRSGGPGRSRALVMLGAAALTLALLPLVALLQRMPWRAIPELLTRSSALDALRLSAIVSVSALVLVVVLGLPIAYLLARVAFPGRRVVRALVLMPLVLPPVVGGTALVFALGRRGLVGQWLYAWFDITIPFSTAGAVIAAAFVALPFFVTAVEAALVAADGGYDDVAATLGAGPWRRFLTVTLPEIRPALTAGAALAWARALGEFGATITFAGNLAGRTQTLPLAVFLELQQDPEASLALSFVMLLISITVLAALRTRWMPK